MSVSRIPILLSINNVIDVEGELVRHLSPLTIKKILSCFAYISTYYQFSK